MALQQLQKDSGQRLDNSVIIGFTKALTQQKHQLMKTKDVSMWGNSYTSTYPLNSGAKALSMRRWLAVLSKGANGNMTDSLNEALLGGKSYPVLEAALGVAVGLGTFGTGLLFTAATLGVSLSRRTSRVLAREGDELWQVEEIGNVGRDTVHVAAFILFDPFRNKGFNGAKGWLVHEERHTLT